MIEAADVLARLREQPGGKELMAAADGNTYLVGGAVRDLLLGRTPRELDVVVEGDGAALARRLGATVEHPQFKTASVELGGARIDAASARRERYAAPGALPEVEPASLEEDLRRRDFTVNAIAVALDGERPGETRQVERAMEDLRAGRLRVLHEESFEDDPTRLLRLARYAARLGFEVEPRTAELARKAVRDRALGTVSGARIGAELRLALGEGRDGAMAAIEQMDRMGLLEAVHPRLRWERGPVERAMELLPARDGRADVLIMAGVALGLVVHAGEDPRAELTNLLNRLEFVAGDRERVVTSATSVPRLMGELPSAERPSQLRSVVAGVPVEGVALAGGLHEPAADGARRWLGDLRAMRLQITGEDLIAAGVPEGPEVGRRLAVALDMKLDGELAGGREAELAAALGAGMGAAGTSRAVDVQ